MLTDAELAAMRATGDSALPDMCAIYRDTLAADDIGGFEVDETTLVARVACRLAPPQRKSELVLAERLDALALWIVTLPAGTDIAPTDRITCNGRSFEVVDIGQPHSWEINHRIAVVELSA